MRFAYPPPAESNGASGVPHFRRPAPPRKPSGRSDGYSVRVSFVRFCGRSGDRPSPRARASIAR